MGPPRHQRPGDSTRGQSGGGTARRRRPVYATHPRGWGRGALQMREDAEPRATSSRRGPQAAVGGEGGKEAADCRHASSAAAQLTGPAPPPHHCAGDGRHSVALSKKHPTHLE